MARNISPNPSGSNFQPPRVAQEEMLNVFWPLLFWDLMPEKHGSEAYLHYNDPNLRTRNSLINRLWKKPHPLEEGPHARPYTMLMEKNKIHYKVLPGGGFHPNDSIRYDEYFGTNLYTHPMLMRGFRASAVPTEWKSPPPPRPPIVPPLVPTYAPPLGPTYDKHATPPPSPYDFPKTRPNPKYPVQFNFGCDSQLVQGWFPMLIRDGSSQQNQMSGLTYIPENTAIENIDGVGAKLTSFKPPIHSSDLEESFDISKKLLPEGHPKELPLDWNPVNDTTLNRDPTLNSGQYNPYYDYHHWVDDQHMEGVAIQDYKAHLKNWTWLQKAWAEGWQRASHGGDANSLKIEWFLVCMLLKWPELRISLCFDPGFMDSRVKYWGDIPNHEANTYRRKADNLIRDILTKFPMVHLIINQTTRDLPIQIKAPVIWYWVAWRLDRSPGRSMRLIEAIDRKEVATLSDDYCKEFLRTGYSPIVANIQVHFGNDIPYWLPNPKSKSSHIRIQPHLLNNTFERFQICDIPFISSAGLRSRINFYVNSSLANLPR